MLYVCERLERGIHYGYYINDTAFEIIKRLDGTCTYDEIVQQLSNKYSENDKIVREKIQAFIETINRRYGLLIESVVTGRVSIKNVEYDYPVVASLEVTNNCNIKCRHCYGEYGDKNIVNMPLDLGYKLLEELEELGVKIIEFTGGDVTVYSDFARLLRKALSLKFSNIAVLTNGVAVSEELFQTILENKERIVVQIDLHSLNNEYYDWFTQTKGQLKKVKDNIKRFADAGVRIKVVTIVTPNNVDELVDIADWVYRHNVHMFGISAALDMGRCKKEEKEKLIFIHEDGVTRYVENLKIINTGYPGLIHEVEKPSERNNCGAITANFVISPNGMIKICAMDNLCYCNNSIGNVFEESVKDIFDRNSVFIQSFRELKAPNATA